MQLRPISLNVETTWGPISAELKQGKVVHCTLPFHDDDPPFPFAVTDHGNDPISISIASILNGEAPARSELGELEGTPFQQRVWNAIATVPLGQTCTYGELAQRIGQPSAVRAAATACGKNPVPLFIPCHRIVGARGALGGFSAGLAWKRLILAAENQSFLLCFIGLASLLPLG